ncbi:MAG: hypothetical protein AB7O73_07860, partial [Bacteroidia bacterium]
LIEFTKPILPTSDGQYTFDYNVSVPIYHNECTPQLCYSCVYDLSIFVTEECGDTLMRTDPIKVKVGTMSTTDPNGGSCLASYAFQPVSNPNLTNFPVTLYAGKSYNLIKKLSIDQNVVDTYTSRYTDTTHNTCMTTLKNLVLTKLGEIDPDDCDQTCLSCSTNVMNYYVNHNVQDSLNSPYYGYMSEAMKDEMLADCMEKCQFITPCTNNYKLMLADVSPSGQYATYDKLASGTYTAQTHQLSVLNDHIWPSNRLPLTEAENPVSTACSLGVIITGETASFRYPKFYNTKTRSFTKPATNSNSSVTYANYFNEDGSEAKIYILPDASNPGQFIPDVINTTYTMTEASTGKVYIYPQHLKHLKDFVENFQSYWAHSLVVYHPEFSYFKECEKWNNPNLTKTYNSVAYTSDLYDELLKSVETYSDAVSLFPSLANTTPSYADILNNDPFFYLEGSSSSYDKAANLVLTPIKTDFTNELANYSSSGKSIIELAATYSRCGNKFYDCTACNPTFGSASTNQNVTTTTYQNKEWLFLRDAYLATKYKHQMAHSHRVNKKIRSIDGSNSITNSNAEEAVWQSMYNGAIGNPNYDFVADNNYWPYLKITPTFQSGYEKVGFFSKCQTTNMNTYKLYAAKQKRFLDTKDVMSSFNVSGNDFLNQINDFNNHNETELFYLTGQCPQSLQIESFLNYLAINNLYTSTNPIYLENLDGYNKGLYEMLYKCKNSALPATSSCYESYEAHCSISSGVVTMAMYLGTTNFSNITLTPASSINWADVKYLSNISYLGSSSFKLVAHVGSSTNPLTPLAQVDITVQCPTCIVPSCNYPSKKCSPSQEAKDILTALNFILGSKQTSSTTLFKKTASFDLGTLVQAPVTYSNIFTTLFEKPLPGTGNVYYQFVSGVSVFSKGSYQVDLSYTSISGPTSIDFDLISHFISIKPDATNANRFYIKAQLINPCTSCSPVTSIHDIQVDITYNTSSSNYPYILGDCHEPLPSSCNTPKAKATLDMKHFSKELVDKVLANPTTSSSSPTVLDFSNSSYYSNSIKSMLPCNSHSGTAYVDNTGSPTKIFMNIGGGSCDDVETTPCGFTLEINPSSNLNFGDVYVVESVEATNNDGELVVYFKTNVNQKNYFIITSECMKFLNCKRCEETESIYYTEDFSSYNSSNLPSYTSNYNTPTVPGTSAYTAIYDLANSSLFLTCYNDPSNNTITSSDVLFEEVLGFYVPWNYSSFPYTFWSQSFSSNPIFVSNKFIYLSFDMRDCKGSSGEYKIFANGSTEVASFNLAPYNNWENVIVPLNMNNISHLSDLSLKCYSNNQTADQNPINLYIDNIKLFEKSCEQTVATLYPPQEDEEDCKKQQIEMAITAAYQLYKKQIDEADKDFREKYKSKCRASLEAMTAEYTNREHHYTLYYYDQAGNLIKTVPPEGVEIIDLSAFVPNTSLTYADAIEADRVNSTHEVKTNHRMATRYEYNSLNQLLRQQMPDHNSFSNWQLNSLSSIPQGFVGNEITFDPDNHMVGYIAGKNAAGNGQLLKTTDGGITWSIISSINYGTINSIKPKPGSTTNYFAVTDQGYLLYFDGTNWSDITAASFNGLPSGSLNDICFDPITNDGFIAGNNGQLFYSKDVSNLASEPFTQYNPAPLTSNNLNKIKYLNGYVFIVGDKGTMIYSEFMTNTYLQPYQCTNQINANIDLKDAILYYSDPNNTNSRREAIVVGYDNNAKGKIILVDNPINKSAFLNAQNQNHLLYTGQNVDTKLSSISSVESGGIKYCISGGQNGKALFTSYTPGTGNTASGIPTNWINLSVNWLNSNQASDITSIISDGTTNYYFSLANGNYLNYNLNLTSANENLNPVSQASAKCLTFKGGSNTEVLMGAENSNITQITNITSTPSFALQSQYALQELSSVAVKNGKVIAVGLGGQTLDNFANGNFVANTQPNNPGDFTDVKINSNGDALIVGDSYLHKLSSTGVYSWNSSNKPYKAVTLTPTNEFYAVTSGYSTDVIDKIDISNLSVTNACSLSYPMNDIHALSYNALLAVGPNGKAYKATYNGSSWSSSLLSNLPSSQNMNSLDFINSSNGFIFGENNTVFKTTDGGLTWSDNSGTGSTIVNSGGFSPNGNVILTGSGASNLQEFNDEGDDYSSKFIYDQLGRLVISQNSKQVNKSVPAYSYTKYDALGRIIEVGEAASSIDPELLATLNGVITDNAYNNWLTPLVKTEVTSTHYDLPAFSKPAWFTQDNLRKRIAATYIDTDGNLTNGYTFATYYSYDIHGNVKSLLNDYPALAYYNKQYSQIDYEFDLISGKVNKVTYQKDKADQFIHKYEYDDDNRITNVVSSRDGAIWDQEAKYYYYKHGPLARVEIGNEKVQAMDYAYTLQGWIKAVNSGNLDETFDQGKDGTTGSLYDSNQSDLHKYITRDAFGYNLSYNATDYSPINLTAYNAKPFNSVLSSNPDMQSTNSNLYNGNIRGMVTALKDPLNNGAVKPILNSYKYDQLNRLALAKSYSDITLSNNSFGDGSQSTSNYYKNEFNYDANGNILTQKRYDQSGVSMDDQTYQYHKDANGKMVSNRLYHVNDNIGSGVSTTDVDDQGTFTPANSNNSSVINSSNNYKYDEIGNLIKDEQEKITNVKWNVYGKIAEITKFIPGTSNMNTEVNIVFDYDPAGNRVKKSTAVTSTITSSPPYGISYDFNEDYYIRDAQGNVMATYNTNSNYFGNTIVPTEFNLFGSSRLGMLTNAVDMTSINMNPANTTYTAAHIKGNRKYEMSNHLGNVLTVVSDRKIGVDV